jgi:signal transduction histidine kinase
MATIAGAEYAPIGAPPMPGMGRRDLVGKAIGRQLDQIRIETNSDIVIVVEMSALDRAAGIVLATSAAKSGLRFLPNEPVWMSPVPASTVMSMSDLKLVSSIRPFRLDCGSSVAIPWCSRDTSGLLVIANVERSSANSVPARLAREYSRRLRQTYIDADLRNSAKLQRDLGHAIRRLSEYELGTETEDELIANVIAIGRGLMKTAACYMSMPEEGSDVFSFASFLGVRTKAFKSLRMSAGQGLGGVARQERHVVRSLNYAQDFTERDAPVAVSVREGFLSAMCAPLMGDGKIIGCLYVANRGLTAFSQSDAQLMEDFADNVSLMFRRTQWDRLRLSTARRAERDRIARDLHDTVVRRLMEIGYESRLGRDRRNGGHPSHHFDAIEAAAESCLQTIRGHIGALTREWDGAERPTAAELLGRLRVLSCPRYLDYSFSLGEDTGAQTVEPAMAAALIRIGREALQNAEEHSGGSHVKVKLAIDGGSVDMTIDDDGQGMDFDSLPDRLARRDHLGLNQMRSLAKEFGGRCVLMKSPRGGLRVRVTGPLA